MIKNRESTKQKIHLVVSILRTCATFWVDGEVVQAWDFETGVRRSRHFGWLMTFPVADEMGVA